MIETLTYDAVVLACRLVYAVNRWKIRAYDQHHIPLTGPFVMASNHVSHLDPINIALPVHRYGRRMAFMGKRELFENPLLGPVFNAARMIPVDRGGGGGDAIETAISRIEEGMPVVIFPEGTISRSFVPQEPHTGVGRVALATGVPVIPVVTWGGQRIFTKGRPRQYRFNEHFDVRFGAPVLPTGDSSEMTAKVWRSMTALADRVSREYSVRPVAGDDWWCPAHLGGSAPTPEAAQRLATKEASDRRSRRETIDEGPT